MIDPFRFTKYIFVLGLNLPTVVMGSSFTACLPKDITLNDVISATAERTAQDSNGAVKLTVGQRLIELRARCKNDHLTDVSGKRITFYKLTGCWGNLPFNYQDILKRQEGEIEKLKKDYTVVEITCNPSGVPIP